MNKEIDKILNTLKNNDQFKNVLKKAEDSPFYVKPKKNEKKDFYQEQEESGEEESGEEESGEEESQGFSPFLGALLQAVLKIPLRSERSFEDFCNEIKKFVTEDEYNIKNQIVNILFKAKTEKTIDQISLYDSNKREEFRQYLSDLEDKYLDFWKNNTPVEAVQIILKHAVEKEHIKPENIKVAIEQFKIPIAEEGNIDKWYAFFTIASDTLGEEYGKPFLDALDDAIKILQKGAHAYKELSKVILKMKKEAPQNYQYLLQKTEELLSDPAVLGTIDGIIKEVQVELGAQVSGTAVTGILAKAGHSVGDRQLNIALQNVFGYFLLFTFLYIALSAPIEGPKETVQDHWLKYKDKFLPFIYQEMIQEYSENILTNIISGISGLYYNLGKRYRSFQDVMSDFPTPLETLIAKPQLLNQTIGTLAQSNLINETQVREFLSGKLLEEKIYTPSKEIEGALASLKNAFTNEDKVVHVVKEIFQASGIKQSLTAKIFGTIGKGVSTVAGVAAGSGAKSKVTGEPTDENPRVG